MINPIVHFEIPADDPKRAKAFYEKIFGWKIAYNKEFDYYIIKAKGSFMNNKETGIDGGLMKRKMSGQPFTNYIYVPSIDTAIIKIVANGGTVCMPKTPIGTMGAIAAFTDPEGNLIGLHEMTMLTKNAQHTTKSIKKSAKKG